MEHDDLAKVRVSVRKNQQSATEEWLWNKEDGVSYGRKDGLGKEVCSFCLAQLCEIKAGWQNRNLQSDLW